MLVSRSDRPNSDNLEVERGSHRRELILTRDESPLASTLGRGQVIHGRIVA